MGRRPSGALPVMRHHRPNNTARDAVGDEVHSLARLGGAKARTGAPL